jgi:hypothetical protein
MPPRAVAATVGPRGKHDQGDHRIPSRRPLDPRCVPRELLLNGADACRGCRAERRSHRGTFTRFGLAQEIHLLALPHVAQHPRYPRITSGTFAAQWKTSCCSAVHSRPAGAWSVITVGTMRRERLDLSRALLNHPFRGQDVWSYPRTTQPTRRWAATGVSGSAASRTTTNCHHSPRHIATRDISRGRAPVVVALAEGVSTMRSRSGRRGRGWRCSLGGIGWLSASVRLGEPRSLRRCREGMKTYHPLCRRRLSPLSAP